MIYGRSAERSALLRVLDAASDGTGGHLLILGEPGIGKSTLLGEARSHAKDAGFTLVDLRGRRDDTEALPIAAEWLAALAPLARSDGARPGDWSAAIAVQTALACTLAPVLVIIDDLQDLDRPDLGVLALAERRLERLPVAIIAASRPTTVVASALTGWSRLAIERLSPEAAVALLKAEFGDDYPSAPLEVIAEALGIPRAARGLSADELAGVAPLPRVLPVPAALDQADLLATLPDASRRPWSTWPWPARPDVLTALADGSGASPTLTSR